MKRRKKNSSFNKEGRQEVWRKEAGVVVKDMNLGRKEGKKQGGRKERSRKEVSCGRKTRKEVVRSKTNAKNKSLCVKDKVQKSWKISQSVWRRQWRNKKNSRTSLSTHTRRSMCVCLRGSEKTESECVCVCYMSSYEGHSCREALSHTHTHFLGVSHTFYLVLRKTPQEVVGFRFTASEQAELYEQQKSTRLTQKLTNICTSWVGSCA